MFVVHEDDFEYRFGSSGPKYLMKGPRMNFALVRVVDGKVNTLTAGQFIHIEPGEIHYVINNYDRPIKMVSTLAPYQAVDKVEVPDYKY